MNNSEILPSYIDSTNFKYIKVDNKYLASITVSDYPRYIKFLEMVESIPKDVSFDMSIYIRKQNTTEILKKLTYNISSFGTEKKTVNENQLDIDIIDISKSDAKELRRQIQINNQEIYYINIYITFFNQDKKTLLNTLKEFQSKLYSKKIISNITNFRHLDSYLLTLPIINLENFNLRNNYRNITTSTLSNIFPFYTKNIFDKTGVMFGYTKFENKICNIDIFENKYLNANMCIFGSSGSGKSFFTKLLIIRNYLLSNNQYIFDPEGEYLELISKIGGKYLSFSSNNVHKNYVNIMDIDRYDIIENEKNFLDKKVENVLKFIIKICDVNDAKDISDLKDSIIYSYLEKEITNDINSIYSKDENYNININKKIIASNKFPNLIDVANRVKSKELKNILNNRLINKYPSIVSSSNVDIYSKLFLIDISRIDIRDSAIIMEYFLNKIQNALVKNRIDKKNIVFKNTIFYIDEVWKYIRLTGNCNLAENIFMMFKTIRKLNASIVTITQDVSDFFAFDNGEFGRSILNNCNFKMFFKMDFRDVKILENISVLDLEYLKTLSYLNKGQAMLAFKNNIITLNIKANNYEKSLIEGEEIENFSCIR